MKKNLLLLFTFIILFFLPSFSQTLYTSTTEVGSRANAGLGALGTPVIIFDDVLIPSTQVMGSDSIRFTKVKFGINRAASAPAITVKFYYSILDDTATSLQNATSLPPVLFGSVNLPANGTTGVTTIVSLGDSITTLFAIKTDTGNVFTGYQLLFLGLSFSNTDVSNGWTLTMPGGTQSQNLDALWVYDADDLQPRYAVNFGGPPNPSASFYLQAFGGGFVLPVSLSTFNAKRTNGANVLNWTTEQELNTNHFVVERSSDGVNFTEIGRVAAARNSNTIRNYTFTDVHPLRGNNYYRLQTIDNDNSSKSSVTRRIRNEGIADISVYPNPVKDRFTVSINADKAAIGQLSITDISGKTVYTRSLKLAQGNTILPVDLNHVSTGSYILKIQLNDDLIVQKINKL